MKLSKPSLEELRNKLTTLIASKGADLPEGVGLVDMSLDTKRTVEQIIELVKTLLDETDKKAEPIDKEVLSDLATVTQVGDELAVAAARVCTEYDGVHRLRAALANWYNLRAGVHGKALTDPEEENDVRSGA
jgi:hypothetical protein